MPSKPMGAKIQIQLNGIPDNPNLRVNMPARIDAASGGVGRSQ
jgi:hypothetical protein